MKEGLLPQGDFLSRPGGVGTLLDLEAETITPPNARNSCVTDFRFPRYQIKNRLTSEFRSPIIRRSKAVVGRSDLKIVMGASGKKNHNHRISRHLRFHYMKRHKGMGFANLAQQFLRGLVPKRFYFEDALITSHNHAFVEDPAFAKAYSRGLRATDGFDHHNRWRIHVALWVARSCAKLNGDFIECGVNYGFTSSAIMEDLGWNDLGRQFWLIDGFSGIDEAQLTDLEKELGYEEMSAANKRSGMYNCSVERCQRNFSQWQNVRIVQGWVPQCLDAICTSKVAYMHLDLNSAAPEVLAFKHFFPRLCAGAFVLLDDYGYAGGGSIFIEWGKLAKERGLDILSLPTGQGLIRIPPNNTCSNVTSSSD